MSKFQFGPNLLSQSVFVVSSREYVRSKAYYLGQLFRYHLMVLRLLENFLRAFEILCVENWGSQKQLKIIDFRLSEGILGRTEDFFNSNIRTGQHKPQ